MDTFRNWFKKKPREAPENPAASAVDGSAAVGPLEEAAPGEALPGPLAVAEAAAESLAEGAAEGAPASEEVAVAPDLAPGAVESAAATAPASGDTPAAPDSVPAPGVTAAVPSEAADQPEEAPPKKGFLRRAWEKTKAIALTPVDPFFIKMARGLDRTRQNLVGQVVGLFGLHKKIDEEFWEELEDILITSDVGPIATTRIMDTLRAVVKEKKLSEPPQLLSELKAAMGQILLGQEEDARELDIQPGRLNVVLMVGVNGTGKTTSTAKLAHFFQENGLKVMLVAADTFRAAAIEQLEIWGQRLDIDVIHHKEGADPAAVVFDAMTAARARNVDLLLVDTAGRLHSKVNLMEELKKIRRVVSREQEGAPHEVLLVLDATTGQNAVNQAREFRQAVDVTGLVLCKLDGTAKGGIVVSIAQEFALPVKFIGVGEGVDDLRPFQPDAFLEALFGESTAEQEQGAPTG